MNRIGLNKEQILKLIEENGFFYVHKYKHGESNLRSKLKRMKKEGLIVQTQSRIGKDFITYGAGK